MSKIIQAMISDEQQSTRAKRLRKTHMTYIVMIGLLYKAYPDDCQQVLLRQRPYRTRGHRLS